MDTFVKTDFYQYHQSNMIRSSIHTLMPPAKPPFLYEYPSSRLPASRSRPEQTPRINLIRDPLRQRTTLRPQSSKVILPKESIVHKDRQICLRQLVLCLPRQN